MRNYIPSNYKPEQIILPEVASCHLFCHNNQKISKYTSLSCSSRHLTLSSYSFCISLLQRPFTKHRSYQVLDSGILQPVWCDAHDYLAFWSLFAHKRLALVTQHFLTLRSIETMDCAFQSSVPQFHPWAAPRFSGRCSPIFLIYTHLFGQFCLARPEYWSLFDILF